MTHALRQIAMSVADINVVEPFTRCSSGLNVNIADYRYERTQRIGNCTDEPDLVALMVAHNLSLSFFNDPSGNTLALMMEAPITWSPTGGN